MDDEIDPLVVADDANDAVSLSPENQDEDEDADEDPISTPQQDKREQRRRQRMSTARVFNTSGLKSFFPDPNAHGQASDSKSVCG